MGRAGGQQRVALPRPGRARPGPRRPHPPPAPSDGSALLADPAGRTAAALLEFGERELARAELQRGLARVGGDRQRLALWADGLVAWGYPGMALRIGARLGETGAGREWAFPRGHAGTIDAEARAHGIDAFYVLALIRQEQIDEARQELDRLRRIAADPALDDVTLWGVNGTTDLLEIAVEVVAGELAAAGGDTEDAVRRLEVALDLESTLLYDEPPACHQPVRQLLGVLLLDAARAEDAERVYREDLSKFPHNGWSLHGLAEALEAQGRTREAEQVRRQLRQAWKSADVTLTSSRF